MTNTRWTRTLLGGLAAGVVFNVGGMISALLLGLPESFVRFGVEPSLGVALLHTALRLALGIAGVALHPERSGAVGPVPVVRTGLLLWFAAYVPGTTILWELGVLSGAQLVLGLAWGIPEATAALWTGVRLRDRAPTPAR